MSCPDEMAGQQVSCPKCGAAFQVPAQQAGSSGSGQQLGEYQLVRKIGQGGMGAVYEALQTKLNRQVALKILPKKSTQDRGFLERFYREAQAAAALNHPNIIQVYDIAEDKGHHFFAMEFVDGENLMQRLKRDGKLPADEALAIAEQVAKGLQFAHQRSIIHRDIKPDNIMVARDGQLKLADLGLAKSTEDDKGVTQTGAGLGTPYYMAPEQAQDARNVDHRADIYSLGITLLHLVTGQRPFDGDSAYSIIIQHREQELPSAQELGAEIARGVEAVIHKMAAKDPSQRYQDYESLLSDLAKVRSGQPPEAIAERLRDLPTTPAVSGHRTTRTRAAREKPKGKGALVMGIGVAAVALIGIGVFLASRPEEKPRDTSKAKTTTTRDAVDSVGPADKAKELAAMLAYAESYAKDHPDDFSEIIGQFEEVRQKGKTTTHGMEATDRIKAWQKKWDTAALAEVERRRQSADECLREDRFIEASEIWDGFPQDLKTDVARQRIEEQLGRIQESLRAAIVALEQEVAPILAKAPAELTADDVKSLEDLKAKATDSSGRVPDAKRESLADLAEKIFRHLEAHGEASADRRSEALRTFWTQYEGLMKAKTFQEAEGLLGRSGDTVAEKEVAFLTKDTQMVKQLFARAESRLPELKGRTVRVGGIGLRVSDVKGGKVYVKQGGAEMALGMDRLDNDTLLSLARPSSKDAQAATRERALFALYYGKPSDAVELLGLAAEEGEDVSFYVARLVPVLVVLTSPPGASVTLKRKVAAEWETVGQEPLTTPLRQEALKNMVYLVQVSREGYRPESREVEVGEGGEHRVAIKLQRLFLPLAIERDFEIPKGTKDQYGNPIRKDTDRATGLAQEIRHKKTGMHFILISAGVFQMGSPNDEPDRQGNESPVRRVNTRKPFYLGKYQVTQAEWKMVMGANPSKTQNDRNPVGPVSWLDCKEFLKKLNFGLDQSKGAAFALPTEAQWEYACRAGTTTKYFFGDDDSKLVDHAWFNVNTVHRAENHSKPVGQLKPSPWGLYDILGNMQEWCADVWHENYDGAPTDESAWITGGEKGHRVQRGGSWMYGVSLCRCAARSHLNYSWNRYGTLRAALQFPAAKGSDGVPTRFRPGLVLAVYPKHRTQMEDLRLLVPEKELGAPVDVRVSGVNEQGGLLANAERTAFATGFLNIPKSGKYGFMSIGHYTGGSILTVGDVTIEENKTGHRPTWVVLKKGLVPFGAVVRIGNRYATLKWMKPGDRDFSPLPSALLFHDPAFLEKMKRRMK